MTLLHKALNPEPVLLRFSGDDRMEKAFKRTKKRFELEMSAVLKEAGFGGQFGVIIAARIKGTAHHKGLRIGAPHEHLRSVEIRWQEGSNDERFALRLGAPHGMNSMEFHTRLDEALKAINDRVDKAVSKLQPKTPPVAAKIGADVVVMHQSVRAEASETGGVEHLMRVIHELAPDFGLVSRDQCLEVLAESGAGSAFAGLVDEGHLSPLEGSEEMFSIAEHWRVKFAPASAPAEVLLSPAQATQAPPEESAPLPDFLAQLNDLTLRVRRADEYRKKLIRICAEIAHAKRRIEEETARLKELEPQQLEAEEFLTSPDLKQAEDALAAAGLAIKSSH